MNRLEILKKSLEKKEQELQRRFDVHFSSVKQANGQPLNDKRNGQATLNKWERQNVSIKNVKDSIQKTKDAIIYEEGKIKTINYYNDNIIPKEILDLVDSGELIQWKKNPNTFFVSGVEKARIYWDKKRKLVSHKYVQLITIQEQRSKFVKIYNNLNSILNKKKLCN